MPTSHDSSYATYGVTGRAGRWHLQVGRGIALMGGSLRDAKVFERQFFQGRSRRTKCRAAAIPRTLILVVPCLFFVAAPRSGGMHFHAPVGPRGHWRSWPKARAARTRHFIHGRAVARCKAPRAGLVHDRSRRTNRRAAAIPRTLSFVVPRFFFCCHTQERWNSFPCAHDVFFCCLLLLPLTRPTLYCLTFLCAGFKILELCPATDFGTGG